jgi:ATP-dependent phosphofructokinase / diphosphate-dependent phosphofructokinase
VAASLKERARSGRRFSIVAVAEGARSLAEVAAAKPVEPGKKGSAKNGGAGPPSTMVGSEMYVKATAGQRVAREVSERLNVDARVCSLGHMQRGGTPTAADRILASQLGARAMELIAAGEFGFMMAIQAGKYVPVPLEEVAGKLKLVPLDDPLIKTAREVDTCLGD